MILHSMEEYIKQGIDLAITRFDGVKPITQQKARLDSNIFNAAVQIDGSHWDISCRLIPKPGTDYNGCTYEVSAVFSLTSGHLPNANVSLSINLTDWSGKNYVMFPAAVYNGNRFRVIRKKYPPMLSEEDGWGEDIFPVMNDNPHLNIEGGESKIHLRSGDMASPCVSIRLDEKKQGIQILAPHNSEYGYTGFLLSESEDRKKANLQIEIPAVREKVYRQNRTDIPSDDKGFDFKEGDTVTLKFCIFLFECRDIPELYDVYCATRKCIFEKSSFHNELPFSAAFKTIEEKYNVSQYNSEYDFYKVGADDGIYNDWQAGWVGGGMSGFALMSDGNALSQTRSDNTMNTIFTTLQTQRGFIYGTMYKGESLGDVFCKKSKNTLLVRKNADVLVFAGKQILLSQKRRGNVPETWIEGYKKLAEAIYRLWQNYGQFGQFIDTENETILIGSTCSAGIASGGLALASEILGEKKYLSAAIESGKHYYNEYILKGLTNGGPGEIMQAPDSESAFGLLEAYVMLYEITRDAYWLPIAEDTAKQCASWCMPYDFDFPEESVFGKLKMHTTGSVFANVQNKHSAPGICTLSGASLLKLYRATGNSLYKELLREIAHNITQYLSRKDRPIMAWNNQYMPSGWMCERVNTCDWEGKDKIGGVFYGGCWCEVSAMLTFSEVPRSLSCDRYRRIDGI